VEMVVRNFSDYAVEMVVRNFSPSKGVSRYV